MTHSFPTRRSSDLAEYRAAECGAEEQREAEPGQLLRGLPRRPEAEARHAAHGDRRRPGALYRALRVALRAAVIGSLRQGLRPAGGARSEEHTSELQSLMRISYAGFCLKKQN